MYSNHHPKQQSRRHPQQLTKFLQTYTIMRAIFESNGSYALLNLHIEQPEVFNIRQVQSEEEEYSARTLLQGENFTDDEDKMSDTEERESIVAQNKNCNNGETDNSLRQTAYFSEDESLENCNNGNISRDSQHSVKSKLLSKLIFEKTRKKAETPACSRLESKMEEDISYLKRLKKHCNLR